MENTTRIVRFGEKVINVSAIFFIVVCVIIGIALIIIIVKKNREMKELSKEEKNKKLSPYITWLIGILIFLMFFIRVILASDTPNIKIGNIYQQLKI